MKKRIERKEERIAAIRSEAARHRGVYAEVARENGWGKITYAASWRDATAARTYSSPLKKNFA